MIGDQRVCAACGGIWSLGQYPPSCRSGGICHTAETRRAAEVDYDDHGEPIEWLEHWNEP